MQEQIFVHGYFGRNKGILTGFVIFSIMSGTSYMLWSFLFEQASGFAGGTADTSIQQLCLSAGLCLLYFVVSQQLMFYFQRRLLKQINTQLKQDVFHALMKKRCGKVYGEKQRGISVCVKQ
jgi:ATP-binding cassette subfamily B protein